MNQLRLTGEFGTCFVVTFSLFLGYFLLFSDRSIVVVNPIGVDETLPTFADVGPVQTLSESERLERVEAASVADAPEYENRRQAVIYAGQALLLSPCNADFKNEYLESTRSMINARIARTDFDLFGNLNSEFEISILDEAMMATMTEVSESGMITDEYYKGRNRKLFYRIFANDHMPTNSKFRKYMARSSGGC